MNKSLITLAMEEQEQQTATTAAVVSQSGLTEDLDTDTSTYELNERDTHLQSWASHIAFSEAQNEALTNVHDVMDAAGDAGIDSIAADIAQIAVESIYKRLGIKPQVAHSIAAENFGSNMTRQEATKVAMEGLASSIKRIWIAIKNAMRKMFLFLKEFMNRVFDANSRLAARATKVLTAAKKISNHTPKKATLNSSLSFRHLITDYTGGIFTDGHFLANPLEAYKKVAQLVVDGGHNCTLLGHQINELHNFNQLIESDEKFKELKLFDYKKLVGFHDDGKPLNSPNDICYMALILPGRISISFIIKDNGSDTTLAQALKGTHFKIEKTYDNGHSTFGASAELPALSGKAIQENAQGVLHVTDAVEKAKGEANELAQAHAKLINQLDSATVNDSADKATIHRIRDLQSIATSYNRLVGEFLTVTNKLALRVCGACLDYAQASLKQYDQEKDITDKGTMMPSGAPSLA